MSKSVLTLNGYFAALESEMDDIMTRGNAALDYIDQMYEVAMNNIEIRCIREEVEQEDMIAYFEAEGDKTNEKSKGIFASIIQGIKNFIGNILKFFSGEAGAKAKQNLEDAAKNNEKVKMKFDAVGAGDFLLNSWNQLKHFVTKPFTKLDEADLNKVSVFNNKLTEGFGKFMSTGAGKATGAAAGVFAAALLFKKFIASTKALEEVNESIKRLEGETAKSTGEKITDTAKNCGKAILTGCSTLVKYLGQLLKAFTSKFSKNKGEEGSEEGTKAVTGEENKQKALETGGPIVAGGPTTADGEKEAFKKDVNNQAAKNKANEDAASTATSEPQKPAQQRSGGVPRKERRKGKKGRKNRLETASFSYGLLDEDDIVLSEAYDVDEIFYTEMYDEDEDEYIEESDEATIIEESADDDSVDEILSLLDNF